MKTGIVRDIDKLGRVVIPKEMRTLLGMDNDNGKIKVKVEIYMDDDKIIIKKYPGSCAFCNSEDNLVEYKEQMICADCVNKISNL